MNKNECEQLQEDIQTHCDGMSQDLIEDLCEVIVTHYYKKDKKTIVTYAQDANEKITEFFSLVIAGIREEYENGASCRKVEIDVSTMKELLAMKDYRIRQNITKCLQKLL